MDDTSRMLTQEEIDAMFSKTSAKPAPAHKVVSEPPPARVIPAVQPAAADVRQVNVTKIKSIPEASAGGGHHHEDCIAAGDINALYERLSELANRVSRLEAVIAKFDVGGKNQTAQVNPATLKATIQQIQNVSSQVEVISEGLRGTAGYNLNKVFTCSACGSVGVVAIKVKCTKCGQENWWGWWPKKK